MHLADLGKDKGGVFISAFSLRYPFPMEDAPPSGMADTTCHGNTHWWREGFIAIPEE